MPPSPTIIFDKSAFQSLSRREHAQRFFRYEENITPILLREILADLAKTYPEKSPEEAVQVLAQKFLGSGGFINTDYRKLCLGHLTGWGHFEMVRRPVLDDYSRVREPDGSISLYVGPTAANEAIMRWADAEFSERERRSAAGLRAKAASLSLDALYGRLRQHHVLIPRPKRIAEIATIADDLLIRPELQWAFIDWMMAQLGFEPRLRSEVEQRWLSLGRPLLAKFAPYAHHCARVLLLLLIGMRHKILSDRKTNRLDAEYLFYTPFCDVFVSGDRLHRQLAPMVLDEKQTFVWIDKFKSKMQKLALATRQNPDGVECSASGAASDQDRRVREMPTRPNSRIILDTSVVTETVRGNAKLGIDLAVLGALRGHRPVSLSQTAYFELTNQLRNQKFTFEQWQVVAPALDEVVDPEIPIVPLGTALRVMLGVEIPVEAEMKRGLRGLRAMWHVLKTARASNDLEEGRQIVFEDELREFRASGIKGELDKTEQRWGRAFDGMVAALGRPIAPGDRAWLATAIRRKLGDEDVRLIPELETTVQLAIEWLVLHGRRYEQGQGYKPKLNDAMDFDQLYALGLPAIICTSDDKFIRRVRPLKTPGSERILNPSELINQLRSFAA
jgi:hypothetical protein